MHHHHLIDFLAQLFFWMSLNYSAPRVPLETLERELAPVSYEEVLASCDVATWRTR